MGKHSQSAIAIIPARAGSKRVPNKNILDFHGKPIIAYSIEAALESKLFEKVVVSTDSDEIKAIASQYGAEVPFLRSEELSDDFATLGPVILDALQRIEEMEGQSYDHLCSILATAVFIKPDDLRQAYQKLLDGSCQSVISIAEYSYPIARSLNASSDGYLQMNWPENYLKRSQDLPQAYHDAGQFYWAAAKAFKREKRFLMPETKGVLLPKHRVQDIDTLDDLEFAKRLFAAEEPKS